MEVTTDESTNGSIQFASAADPGWRVSWNRKVIYSASLLVVCLAILNKIRAESPKKSKFSLSLTVFIQQGFENYYQSDKLMDPLNRFTEDSL